jgi:hypothetical protein
MLAEPCRIDRIRQSGTQFAVLTVLAALNHVAHMHTIATVVLSLLRSGPFQKSDMACNCKLHETNLFQQKQANPLSAAFPKMPSELSTAASPREALVDTHTQCTVGTRVVE